MKITKRVLAVLLLSVLLISCLLLTVSAEQTFKAEGITDIEDVLQYFEEKDYLADYYEDGAISEHYTENALNSEIVPDPKNSENKVLKVTGPAKNNKYSLELSEDTLVISFDIYYDSDMSGAYAVDMKTTDVNGEQDKTFTSFLKLDVKNGKLMNSVFDKTLNNGNGAYVLTEYADFTPAADTWYKIVMLFSAVDDKYSFRICAEGEETWHSSPEYELSAESFTEIELKPYLEGRSLTDKISLCLDNVRIYSGTFERNPDKKTDIVNQTILDLEALYLADGTDSVNKMRIAEVFKKLVAYGYTSDNEAVKKALDSSYIYINLAYAEEVIKRAEAIDKTATYHDRIDYVNDSLIYAANIPTDDQLDTAPGFEGNEDLIASIKAARAVFAEEQAACDKILADSSAFQLKMKDYEAENKNYSYIKTFYAEAAAFLNVDYTFHGAVEGAGDYTMEQAEADFAALAEKHGRIDAIVTAFLDGTSKMLDAVLGFSNVAAGDEAYEKAFGLLSEGYYIVDGIILNVYEDILNESDTAPEPVVPEVNPDTETEGEQPENQPATVEENTDTTPAPIKIIELDEELDERTIPGFYKRNQVYFEQKEFVLANMAVCDEFLAVMKQASAASYYTAKVTYYEQAKEVFDRTDASGAPLFRPCAFGVVDAVTEYKELEKYIIESNANADSYKKAVAAAVVLIENPESSFADKKAAVDAALALKEAGDVNGIEGVAEANSTLSKYSTYINGVINDSAALISLVAKVAEADTFAERRTLLVAAAKAAANCEITLEGVSDALTSFAQYKEAYEAEVEAMNNAHTSATVNALATAGAAATDDEVYVAVDIMAQYVEQVNTVE